MPGREGDDKPGKVIRLREIQVTSGAPADHRVSRTCDQEKAEMQALTNAATSKSDPRARNKDITAAYKALADKCPDNRWIKLGSYVSAQAGCAMDNLSGFQANAVGQAFFNPSQAVNGLGDVKKPIFVESTLTHPSRANTGSIGYRSVMGRICQRSCRTLSIA